MAAIRAMRTWVVYACLLGAILIAGGCNAPKKHLEQFNQLVVSGNIEQAKAYAEGMVSNKTTPRGEDLLWMLQAGGLARAQGNYIDSTQAFDTCEVMMKHFDSEDSELGHTIGSLAVNDNIVPYTGTVYDGVMVNTYKGLNFISEGKYDLARVEFNRALDRQRRAKEAFNQEIQKVKEETAQDKNSSMVQKTMDSPDMKTKLEEAYPSMANFSVYPDFVNPFATYIAGVFFAAEGDYKKAVDLLKESAGMVSDNPFVLEDFAAMEQVLDTGQPLPATVWVVFENGLGPVKEETRIDLPLFIATDNVRYFGIALPKLQRRYEAMPSVKVTAGGTEYQTQIVTDMDAVIETEFNKDFQAILTRAIMAATGKAIMQYSLEKDHGGSAAVIMAIYSAMTTAADVRIWTTLPKNIQVARVAMPEDGKVTVGGPSMAAQTLDVSGCKHAIVYVRMIHGASPPAIDVMKF